MRVLNVDPAPAPTPARHRGVSEGFNFVFDVLCYWALFGLVATGIYFAFRSCRSWLALFFPD